MFRVLAARVTDHEGKNEKVVGLILNHDDLLWRANLAALVGAAHAAGVCGASRSHVTLPSASSLSREPVGSRSFVFEGDTTAVWARLRVLRERWMLPVKPTSIIADVTAEEAEALMRASSASTQTDVALLIFKASLELVSLDEVLSADDTFATDDVLAPPVVKEVPRA